ncbi:MAG: PilZ domain-containing protein [Desulfobacterales bacterium]|jgi:Tfp pilus assembly protein PilZ|nr:PilZ domain-containing protein [Desulfobacterales bacterium]
MEKSSDKRLSKRLHVPLPVKYTLFKGSNGKVITNDISITGICLLLPQKLDIGTELTLTIQMPRRSRETVVYGKVAWQQKSEELTKEGYITGMSFSKADPLDVEEIVTSARGGQYFISHKRSSP